MGGLSQTNAKIKEGTLTLPERWIVRVQGNCVEVSHYTKHIVSPPPVKRDVVKNFSPAARMRMLRYTAKVDWVRVGKSVFITLTYPDSHVNCDYKQRTIHRSMFARALEEHLGCRVSAIWRVEWLPRRSGAYKGYIVPHWHMIACGIPFVQHQMIRQIWRNVLHAAGPLATDVREIKGVDGAARYLCKYMAKSSSLDNGAYLNGLTATGRHWGVLRPAGIPKHKRRVHVELFEDEIEKVKDVARERFENYGKWGEGGFTLFGSVAAEKFGEMFQNTVAIDVDPS